MTDPYAPPTFTPSQGAAPVASIPVTPRLSVSLATALAGSDDPIAVQRRWAVITAVNSDGTVNINLGGVVVQNIARDANYSPVINDRVRVDVVGTDMTVLGPTAPGARPAVVDRTATITTITVAGTAPGAPTTVNITLDDGATATAVPFLSPYFPTVGDSVHVQQIGTTFLVTGAVGRMPRRPTGDIEPTIMTTAKTNTLLLNGATVSRTTFAALWAWAQINGLVTTGLFTTGNGTTTFGLPDFRGRVPVGAGTLGSDTYSVGTLIGSSSITLATNQMPSHKHNVSVNAHAQHDHFGLTSFDGAHGGHANDGGLVAAGTFATPVGATFAAGGHNHSIPNDGPTTHTVNESNIGGTTAVDVRQPSIGVNWMIWV
jgi:microcystin-dependent protein